MSSDNRISALVVNRRSAIGTFGIAALAIGLAMVFYTLGVESTPCRSAHAAQCTVGDSETFTGDVTFEDEINVGATPGPGSAGSVFTSQGADLSPEWALDLAQHKASGTSITNDDTLTDDPDLTFTVLASTDYELTATLLLTSAATPDFKFNWTIPGTGSVDGSVSFNAGSSVVDGFTESADLPIFVTTTTFVVTMRAIVNTDTAGTFAFQWAQNTSDAAATSVDTGSTMRLRQLD